MPRPIQALVHTGALAHNLGVAASRALDSRVWAVVKANAYGHGLERAFEGLRRADGFALLDLDEAQRVRTLGWRGPVLADAFRRCLDSARLGRGGNGGSGRSVRSSAGEASAP